MENERFWLVWNPSRSMPQVRHLTRLDAMNEATRLAKLQPGEKFYILCATGLVESEAHPVKYTPLDPVRGEGQ